MKSRKNCNTSLLKDFFILQKAPLLGIDISSGCIKYVGLSRRKEGFKVEAYGIKPFLVQELSENALRDSISHFGIRCHLAAIALKNTEVIIRVLKIDATFKFYEIVEYIEAEFDNLAPYPLEEAYYDFQIMPSIQPLPRVKEILLIIARIDTVQSVVSRVQALGFKASVVDVEQFALERALPFALRLFREEDKLKSIAYVEVENNQLMFSYFSEMKLKFNCRKAFAGQFNNAEAQRNVIIQQLEEMLNTKTTFPNETTKLTHLILGGELAVLPDLKESIEEKLSIPSLSANPFVGMEISEKINLTALMADAHLLMTAFGLALRTFDND